MNIVITGANRGIGLALVQAYLDQGHQVYALCRNSCDDLNRSGATLVKGVDVANPDSLTEALAPLKNVAIDILINNAGVLGKGIVG